MEPLEGGEDLFDVLLLETDTVIFDKDLKRLVIGRTPYGNDRFLSFFVELESIPDEILKKLPDLRWIGLNNREVSNPHFSSGSFDSYFQIGENLMDDSSKLNLYEGVRFRCESGIFEKGCEQGLHALICIEYPLQIAIPRLSNSVATLLFQHTHEGVYFPQGLLQVMGGYRSEILEGLVASQ